MPFYYNGADTLAASFEQIATVDDATAYAVLEAGGNVHVEKMKEYLSRIGAIRTGKLRDSIQITEKLSKNGEPFIRIQPTGSRGKGGGKRRKDKNGKSHGHYYGTNAEVGYYLEYGTPRMAARHWMEYANGEAEEPATAAMQAAWNQHIEEAGL